MEDQTVTIRERDSMSQERVPIIKVSSIISEKVSLEPLLRKL